MPEKVRDAMSKIIHMQIGAQRAIGWAHYLAVTLREYLWRDEFSHFILNMKKRRALSAVCDGRQKGMNNALDLDKKIYKYSTIEVYSISRAPARDINSTYIHGSWSECV